MHSVIQLSLQQLQNSMNSICHSSTDIAINASASDMCLFHNVSRDRIYKYAMNACRLQICPATEGGLKGQGAVSLDCWTTIKSSPAHSKSCYRPCGENVLPSHHCTTPLSCFSRSSLCKPVGGMLGTARGAGAHVVDHPMPLDGLQPLEGS